MAQSKSSSFLLILLAVIVGELILVLGTTLVQEYFLGGISWYGSNVTTLFLGGIGSFLVAVLSGIVAFSIVRKTTETPIGILSLLVIAETFWLIETGRGSGPTWFDILAAVTLIVGFWVGRFTTKGWNWRLSS